MSDRMKGFIKEWVIPFGIEIIVLLFIYHFVFFFVNVPTGSMIPTILERSFLVSTRVHNPEKSVERGDIIVFNSVEFGNKFVKRTIGLPGEHVLIDDAGKVYIDGKLLDEPYVVNESGQSGEFQVPEDCYLFLGDNRANSMDSRYWQEPYIQAEEIEGKAVFTLWPVFKMGLLK